MSKQKVIVTFSIPVRVKEMLEKLAKATYSSNTKVIVDMIRKDYAFWFDKKEKVNEEDNINDCND